MINILVTVDSNYVLPLKVMLYSLFLNNPGGAFNIYLIYSDVTPDEIGDLRAYISRFSQAFTPIAIGGGMLDGMPVTRYYSKTMYYRLLAPQLLPVGLDKVLYLDPDILVINSVDKLYETDISHYLFGACAHSNLIIDGVNKVRLQTRDLEAYFNSGVLLMNLARLRQELKPRDIFAYVRKNENLLLLPDQDVLNGMFGDRIMLLDDSKYNFDVRKSNAYRIISAGEKDMDWIIENTVILHFCGKQKPWDTKYRNKFGFLYKHYRRMALA